MTPSGEMPRKVQTLIINLALSWPRVCGDPGRRKTTTVDTSFILKVREFYPDAMSWYKVTHFRYTIKVITNRPLSLHKKWFSFV